jgi:hypothetical protein
MNRLLLNGLDAELLKFLIEDLAQVHDHTLMDLLPQMGTEDLNQRNLERRDLAVQKDTSQVKLDLETNIDIGTVYCRRPPECEPTIWNLVETGPLCIGEFFELHGLLKTGSAFPEQSFPGRKCSLMGLVSSLQRDRDEGVSAYGFEQRVFEDRLDS